MYYVIFSDFFFFLLKMMILGQRKLINAKPPIHNFDELPLCCSAEVTIMFGE